MKNNLIYEFLNDDELLRISGRIKEMESATAGEIRVSVKEKKPVFQKSKSTHALAHKEFFRLKMNETRDKTGILIFLILKERKFHILAGEGINKKVPDDTWDIVCKDMQQKFQQGFFCEGILLGIESVGKILSKHFPVKADDTNELSNEVVI
jgi:uncharacterized membrane protein